MSVEVFERRLADVPGEVWYGVRVNGRDLNAGWADPDAARRAGEKEAARIAARYGGEGTMQETETMPDEGNPVIPDTEPEEPDPITPEPNGDGDDDAQEAGE